MANSQIPNPTQLQNGSGEALKAFQLTTEGIQDKSSPEWGKAVLKYIYSTCTTGLGGYYFNRNARFRKNRNYANGRLDIQAMFQDRFQFNSKINYISLNWQTLLIVNRIISGLVGRWMGRGEKIQVTAIDPLSVKDKQDQYEQAEFILNNREKIEKLQQEVGVQLINPDQFIPADKEELLLWQSQLQRLPEEILYEMGCNDILQQNGWFDVMKEKMLHDSAEVGFVGTYTWMDDDGVVHVKWVRPEDAIYSYSDYPDFRDTTWRGEMPSMKISEIRKRFGKEYGGTLDEAQLWAIAQKCKEFQYYTNLTWTDTWYTAYLRPYDEWNIRTMHVELRSLDSEPYTVTKTKSSGSTYTQKGYPTTQSGKRREKPLENQKVIDDSNFNIYEGVYLPDMDMVLKWKLKDNMIRPQDPKEIGNAEFSYSFYMYQNYQMRNIAIPEKVESAVDNMILSLLKMQQLVAAMVPSGWAIDETKLQGVDYGLGDAGNKSVDHTKQFFQTGLLYYHGVDAEGNRTPEPPIKEMANTGFAAQMNALIQNYQFNYQVVKDELGEDPNLMTAAIQPRVTAENVSVSQNTAENATDYMYRAYLWVMGDTARKISCLLKDSVNYGAKVYRNLLDKEDIDGRIFGTKVQMLATEQQVMQFQAILNQAIVSNPDLVLYADPFQLVRVAREDVKLAEAIFRQAQKKMLLSQRQQAAENQQQTIQGQIQSAQAAEEAKQQTEAIKLEADKQKAEITKQAQNQTAVLNGVFNMLAKMQETGAAIPSAIEPMVSAVIENVALGAISATDEQKQAILAKMQQQQAAAQQQMPQQGQPAEEQGEQQMQPQNNNQPQMA